MAPGINGGTNWPGGCYDPETYTAYVYSQTGGGGSYSAELLAFRLPRA